MLARLGLDPWDVFHQGIAEHVGVRIGTATILISGVVLLFWIPLRQRPGIGTLSNAVLVGVITNVMLTLIPRQTEIVTRVSFLVGGVLLNGIATGFYIGGGLGPGPRDGLMTGLAARGHSIRVVRTLIEVTVLALGWLLGGTVGIGTLVYAVAIGPIAHVTVPAFTIGRADAAGSPGHHAGVP